jgi:hypothetical protein
MERWEERWEEGWEERWEERWERCILQHTSQTKEIRR